MPSLPLWSAQSRAFYLALAALLLLGLIACGTVAPTPPTPPTVRPGPVKVVTIGDSQTQGYGDERVLKPEAGGYPAMMIVPIIRLRPDSRVKNLGQPTATSSFLADQSPGSPGILQQALAENPQIICLWIGTNDLLYNNFPEMERPDLETYRHNLDTILQTLTGHGATLAIATLDNPALRPSIKDGSYAINYGWYRQSSNHQVDFDRLARRTAAYNKIILEMARQYGLIVVDLASTGIFSNPQKMSNDGLHPSSMGYQVIANTWLNALLPTLGNIPTLQMTLTLPY